MRAIRRKDRTIPEEESIRLLETGEYGVLATVGPDGNPYGVPLSYVWHDGAVYFHCARDGHKIDNIHANDQVTFTVVGQTRPVYARNFTTYYESVIVFGEAVEVRDFEAKHAVLYALAAKYLPEHLDKAHNDIQQSLQRTAVYILQPQRITGKAKREK